MMALFDKRNGQEREDPRFEWHTSADEAEWTRRLAQQELLTAKSLQVDVYCHAAFHVNHVVNCLQSFAPLSLIALYSTFGQYAGISCA